jgi:hypothetical protein
MGKLTDIITKVKDFFDKWFDRIKNIVKPKLIDNLSVEKEDLANNILQSQNKLKEMVNSEIGILANMEYYVQKYCTELCAMKVDGYARYQELLDNKPTNFNSLTIKERLSKVLQYLQTSTIPWEKTPERKDYEEKFSSFFKKIYDNNLEKFPEWSKQRNNLLPGILPYIDKNNKEDMVIVNEIKNSVQYKKNDIIWHLKNRQLSKRDTENSKGKFTEQDISSEEYDNITILFRKWMEEYSKEPWAQIIRHEDIPDNIESDNSLYAWIEKTDYNNDKIIQSISIHSPFVTIQYTLKDSPNEIKVRELDMKGFARNSFEFKTL